jgi:ABC-type glucose/galactose transport system permease subunit
MNAAVSGVTAGAFSVLAVVGLALLLKTGSPALAIALGLTGLVVIVGTVLAVGAVLVGLIRTGTARTIQQMD